MHKAFKACTAVLLALVMTVSLVSGALAVAVRNDADTISYEIFTCLRNRIPRLYEHAAEVLPAADLAKLDPATLL